MHSVERYFWVFILGAKILGLAFPPVLRLVAPDDLAAPVVEVLGRLMLPFLIGILYFTCLKIDLSEVLGQVRRPMRHAYLAAMLLVVAPVAAYAAVGRWVEGWQLGILLFLAMPVGMASATLVGLCGGSAELALVATTVTSLLCPITVPLVVYFITGRQLEIALWDWSQPLSVVRMFAMLATVIVVPFGAAYLTRKLARGFVARHRDAFPAMAILSLSLLAFCIMASNSDFVLANLGQVGMLLAVVSGLTFILYLGGYWLLPRASVEERVAASVCTAYVNNGLAIVFAYQFFSAQAALPAVLVSFPMVFSIVPVRHIARRLLAGRGLGPQAA